MVAPPPLQAAPGQVVPVPQQLQTQPPHRKHCLAGLDFRFRDPEANFDHGRVKGVVAKLVRVKDVSTATALEVAAGGKLYQVVVDTEATAKALLSKGQLQKRVTIIPMNKVASNAVSLDRRHV